MNRQFTYGEEKYQIVTTRLFGRGKALESQGKYTVLKKTPKGRWQLVGYTNNVDIAVGEILFKTTGVKEEINYLT